MIDEINEISACDINDKQYYVYVYLDNRKPGRYCYDGLDVSFLYEPFYVGKGNGFRCRSHLYDNKYARKYNLFKYNKIKKIIRETGKEPYIIKFMQESEDIALEKEIEYISKIGRIDLKTGTLVNLTTGGENCKVSPLVRQKFSETRKGKDNSNYGNKWNDEQRKKASDYWKDKGTFVNNNPQKINPRRGLDIGGTKYLYIMYDLDGKLVDKNYSAIELSEKYNLNLNCIRKYAKECTIYANYYWMVIDKDIVKDYTIEEQITDEDILKRFKRYKFRKLHNIGNSNSDIFYKYIVIDKDGKVLYDSYCVIDLRKVFNEQFYKRCLVEKRTKFMIDEYTVSKEPYII